MDVFLLEDNYVTLSERFKPFRERGWAVIPESYQLRNDDGIPGLWKSQALALNDNGKCWKVVDTDNRYETEEAANDAGPAIAVRWLEQHA